jgi:hypothetical protein
LRSFCVHFLPISGHFHSNPNFVDLPMTPLGEPGSVVAELPYGGEGGVTSLAISGEPDSEVGEPPGGEEKQIARAISAYAQLRLLSFFSKRGGIN